MTGEHTKDRRVQKTERLLREALVSLIHEKSYDSVAVKEILERANVGESALYAHFHDKDALLASGIHQMLHERSSATVATWWKAIPQCSVVQPSRVRVRQSVSAQRRRVDGQEGRTVIHEHLRDVLIDTIADDVQSVRASPGSRGRQGAAGAAGGVYRRNVHPRAELVG